MSAGAGRRSISAPAKKTGLRETEVAVIFRRPDAETEPDILLIKIQPTEGIYLRFNIKRAWRLRGSDYRQYGLLPELYIRKSGQHTGGLRTASHRLYRRRTLLVLPMGPGRDQLELHRTAETAGGLRKPAALSLPSRHQGPREAETLLKYLWPPLAGNKEELMMPDTKRQTDKRTGKKPRPLWPRVNCVTAWSQAWDRYQPIISDTGNRQAGKRRTYHSRPANLRTNPESCQSA